MIAGCLMTELWIPFAKKYPKQMKVQGTYRKGYPEFALVHHTAGRPGTGVIDYAIRQGYLFLYIDRDGTLYQCNPLNHWGSHAGASSKEGYEGNVSRYCVGIEVSGAGKVEPVQVAGENRYKAWYHKEPKDYFKSSEVRFSTGAEGKTRGFYHAATPEQEETLVKAIHWMWQNNPSVMDLEETCGHEHVAPRRKNDPSATLSMSMQQLVDAVKKYRYS